MFDLIFFTSIVGTTVQAIKDACTPTVPAENWANRELYYKDVMNGVSTKQRMKNLENGKYRMVESHQEPRRDAVSGKVLIENTKLYYDDLRTYGMSQTMKWANNGKYNLK